MIALDECIIAWNIKRTLEFFYIPVIVAPKVEYSVEVIAVSNRNNISGVTGSKPGRCVWKNFGHIHWCELTNNSYDK